MRSVVVFPQPDGPRSVAKAPFGTSKETSFTAATAPKRLVTCETRRWIAADPTLATRHAEGDAPAREEREHRQRGDRERDVRDGEGGRAAPVKVVHELVDTDGRDGRGRREEEDHDGEGRHRPDECRHEASGERPAQHGQKHLAKAAKPGRAEARRGLVDGPIDLPQAGHRGLVSDGDVPEDHREDDEITAIEPVQPRLVERGQVADPEEDPRDGRRHDQEKIEHAASGPPAALHEPSGKEREHRREAGRNTAEDEGVAKRDRKSTRLNSSHSQISYAVFCLKKKKTSDATSVPSKS